MFDFSFGELTVCLLVALVVLGPEKLHGVIRGIGRVVGRARSYMRNLTDELERETELGEVKRQLEETKRMFREQAEEFKATVNSVRQDAHTAAEQSLSEVPKLVPRSEQISTPGPQTSDEGSGHVAMQTLAKDGDVAFQRPIPASRSREEESGSEGQEHLTDGSCDTSENVTDSEDPIGKSRHQGGRG